MYVMSSIAPASMYPALLTTTSTPPASSTAALTIFCVSDDVTSSLSHLPPSFSTSGWAAAALSGLRAQAMTRWPAWRADRVMARPRPEDAPVMSQILGGVVVAILEMGEENWEGKEELGEVVEEDL
jgi:hypothetical protein